MFGLSWPEIMVIVLVAVLVIGPKDIPQILYQVGRFFRRLQYMRFAMSRQFDDILQAGDIEELRRGVNFEACETDERGADADSGNFSPPESEEDAAIAGEAAPAEKSGTAEDSAPLDGAAPARRTAQAKGTASAGGAVDAASAPAPVPEPHREGEPS
ncbi:MAG: twin-arginine translocase TatA/TatE family subunit [Micavibrio sp.]